MNRRLDPPLAPGMALLAFAFWSAAAAQGAPAQSAPNTGDTAWMLVSAALVPVAGVAWALIERSRWSTVIMGIVALSIAVMVWRMNVIWTLQVA